MMKDNGILIRRTNQGIQTFSIFYFIFFMCEDCKMSNSIKLSNWPMYQVLDQWLPNQLAQRALGVEKPLRVYLFK